MVLLRAIAAFTLLLGAGGVANAGQEVAAAEQAALRWLALIDHGRAAEGWQSAAALLRDSIEADQLAQAIAEARVGFGEIIARRRLSGHKTRSLPGSPDGAYVVFVFETEFENKKQAIETVTASFEDGGWRVGGYYIR